MFKINCMFIYFYIVSRTRYLVIPKQKNYEEKKNENFKSNPNPNIIYRIALF